MISKKLTFEKYTQMNSKYQEIKSLVPGFPGTFSLNYMSEN